MKANNFTFRKINVIIVLAVLTLFPFLSQAQLYLTAGNNVGIANPTPGASLSINSLGGTAASTVFTTIHPTSLSSTTGTDLCLASIGFTSANQSSLGIHGYRSATGSDWTTSSIILGMDVDNTTRAGGAFLTLYGNGNVGVGTTAPSEHLDVNGNINIGSSNTFKIGGSAILYNNGSTSNIFVGIGAGNTSATGTLNTFMGRYAGNALTTSTGNSAFGTYALQTNAGSTGYNSAFGYGALLSTTASYNNAFGGQALYDNVSGTDNCAMGWCALYYNSSGSNNTSIGHGSGQGISTGSNNTFLGYGANASGDLSNSTAIGNGAVVATSSTMFMGNSSVTHIYSTAGSFTASDGRFKTNVKENVTGLVFIKKLRPVTYNLDTKQLDDYLIQNMSDSAKTLHKNGLDFTASTAMVRSGFIAQEVEQAAQDVGFVSSIVSSPKANSEIYALSYEELVVPLVKAVQELSTTTDSLKTVTSKQDSLIKVLKKQNDSLKTVSVRQDSINQSVQSQINRIVNTCCPITGHQMQNNGTNGNSANPNVPAVGNTNVNLTDAVVLNQNVPNPFAEQTTITYNIPVINNSAQILFYNTNGTLIKTVEIKNAGSGQLTVFANDLSNGIYSYTLVVDGSIIDTKRMVKQQ